MKKHRKIKIYFIIPAVVLAVYLLLANYSIYYRIHQAGLLMPDIKRDYMLTNSTAKSNHLVYAALGDSLTSGVGATKYEESYPYLLASKLADGKNIQVELKTFSYPGARTGDLIKDLLDPAVDAKPDIITLLIGTNDIHGNIGLENFRKNYDYILGRLTGGTEAKIYAVGLPDLGSDELLFPPYNYYFAKQTEAYNAVIKSLAEKYGCQFIDLNSLTLSASKKNDGYYSNDLFHPSAKGYNLWAQIIYDNINK